jgi:hypothetical protein
LFKNVVKLQYKLPISPLEKHRNELKGYSDELTVKIKAEEQWHIDRANYVGKKLSQKEN